MVFKKLYVNGCSFTAGDNIPDGSTWPELLAQDLNLELINKARNGNSLDTIKMFTILDLVNEDPQDTLVILGLTWKERYGILIDDYAVNVTPADLAKSIPTYVEKLSTYRRVSSAIYHNQLDLTNSLVRYSENGLQDFDCIINSFKEYYQNLVVNDSRLEFNQSLRYTVDLILLTDYLLTKGFRFLLIDFPEHYTGNQNMLKDSKIRELSLKLPKGKIVSMNWDDIGSPPDSTAHPNIEQCKIISNIIKNKL